MIREAILKEAAARMQKPAFRSSDAAEEDQNQEDADLSTGFLENMQATEELSEDIEFDTVNLVGTKKSPNLWRCLVSHTNGAKRSRKKNR